MDRSVFHKLSYGIYVLTTIENNLPYGCIINTAFQITSEPPRIAVSCNKENFTHDKIVSSGVFGVSILAEDADPEVIAMFGYKSGRDTDKFEEFLFTEGSYVPVPLLPNYAMATLQCKVVDFVSVGTHTLFIGEVVNTETIAPDAKEMTYRYYHEVRKGQAPKNAPTYIAPEQSESTSELWKCSVCGYVYDSSQGVGDILAGTSFEDIPDEWVCPVCGVPKSMFNKIE